MSVLKYKDGDEWKSTNTLAVSEEPEAYLKSAAVDGNTLTLTNKDDTTISFTPSGGSGGGGAAGYRFSSTLAFTDEDKQHLLDILFYKKGTLCWIDDCIVIRIVHMGAKYGFAVWNPNGASSNLVTVYTVNVSGSVENKTAAITSNSFDKFMLWYLATSTSMLTGDLLTSDNWTNYISISEAWQQTSDINNSDLYNAKEMIIFYYSSNGVSYIFQSRLKFNYAAATTLGEYANTNFVLNWDDVSTNQVYLMYDGSTINLYNGTVIKILYQT